MEGKGFSRGLPVDDLTVLKGCVSRNRALFSPTSLVGKVSIQTRANKTTGTWPDLISSSQGGSLSARYPSLDILSPSEPHLHCHTDMPFSVSIQFAKGGNRDHGNAPLSGKNSASLLNSEQHEYGSHLLQKRGCLQCDAGNSFSTPSGLNSASLRSCVVMNHSHSNCSFTAFASEPRHKLSVPFTRTNSFGSQTPQMLSSAKSYGKDCFGDTTSSFGSERSLFSSTYTFQEIASKSQYVKGVDGQVFKARMETIQKWFSESNDQQRNMMLLNLLDQCNCAQLHLLSMHMEPILHGLCPLNCQDLLSWLPSNLAFHILSFLDPVSLCRASQVCRIWCHMANDCRLWMKFCRWIEALIESARAMPPEVESCVDAHCAWNDCLSNGRGFLHVRAINALLFRTSSLLHMWQLSESGEQKQRNKYISADGRIMWKPMFGERFRIRRNWLKGFCNVRTFDGHTQGISCIQFDETRIVSGSWDKTIKVWNRRTNTAWAALTLTGHSGPVRCLHLHDNRLVSGSSDRTIKVWDLSTDNVNWVGATCRITMVGHMHTVRCLQADHVKVISGSYDSTLKVWDLGTGLCSLTLRGHADAVLCLHFHGNKLVSGSKDTTIKVWEIPGGSCQLTLHGHQAPVTCVQFDDTRVISGAVDRLIKIWNLETGQCLRTIDWIRSEGHTGVIRHLQADGWKIVSAADDKTLKVWSLATGNRLLTLKSHTDGVTCLQFNDEVIVSGSYDKTVKLWDFSVC